MAYRRTPLVAAAVAVAATCLALVAVPAQAMWDSDPATSAGQQVMTAQLSAVTGITTDEQGTALELGWEAAHDEAEYTVTREIGGSTVPVAVDPEGRTATDELSSTLTTLTQVSAGINHSCALDNAGRAWCWGNNGYAELGIGTYNGYTSSPGLVHGSHRFDSLSSGDRHTCAIDQERRAWCWGSGASGRLGGGPSGTGSTPLLVAGGHAFSQVTAGATHSCGISTDDRAWCWGDNTQGQLGTGSDGGYVDTPVAVAGDARFTRIEAGEGYTCAIATDDRLWCWGDNTDGQLGVDATEISSLASPGLVDGVPQLTALSAGTQHACGVTSLQEIWCWGWNAYGQLGREGADSAPRPVAGGPQVTTIEAGYTHTCAAGTTGTWCWGATTYGKLGVGPVGPSWVSGPMSLPGVIAPSLAIGAYHTCAIVGEGAQCWGMNVVGQLGTGSSAWTDTPADVDLATGCLSPWEADPQDPTRCRPESGTPITYTIDYTVRGWHPRTTSTVTVSR